eukprot:Platyproteum_vivax@DN12042_c0_g1_i1.p1
MTFDETTSVRVRDGEVKDLLHPRLHHFCNIIDRTLFISFHFPLRLELLLFCLGTKKTWPYYLDVEGRDTYRVAPQLLNKHPVGFGVVKWKEAGPELVSLTADLHAGALRNLVEVEIRNCKLRSAELGLAVNNLLKVCNKSLARMTLYDSNLGLEGLAAICTP